MFGEAANLLQKLRDRQIRNKPQKREMPSRSWPPEREQTPGGIVEGELRDELGICVGRGQSQLLWAAPFLEISPRHRNGVPDEEITGKLPHKWSRTKRMVRPWLTSIQE